MSSSPARILYDLIEATGEAHPRETLVGLTSEVLDAATVDRTLNTLVRLGLASELRTRCGGNPATFAYTRVPCERTPFDVDDRGRRRRVA